MSNKTQLQTNNTTYTSLIEVLRGKAAGGSSGGASMETCTVNITFHSASIGHYVFTTYENGALSGAYRFDTSTSLTSTTISNVAVGSIFYINYSGGVGQPQYQLSGGISNVDTSMGSLCGKVDNTEDGLIEFYDMS